MDCYTYLRNIQDLLSDGKTPYERRCGMPFNGPIIPFGATVDCYPVSAKDQSRLQQFGKKVLPGIFLGYALPAGCIWNRDIMVADIEEMEEMDASEFHARRLNAKEVLTPMKGDNFMFPFADGTVQVRTSTLNQEHPERGEEEILQGNSNQWYAPPNHEEDSTRDDEEARNDFWTITGEFIFRHHVLPRVKLYMPEEETFPIVTKYIDVTRTTHTSLDVMTKKNIEDYWNVYGENRIIGCMDRLHKIHLIERKATWSGRSHQRKQYTSRSDDTWPDMWTHMSDAAK